jgi:hypothetical protein
MKCNGHVENYCAQCTNVLGYVDQKWEDGIKIDLQLVKYAGKTGFIWLRMVNCDELL